VKNQRAYLSAVATNDQLLEIRKKIDDNIAQPELSVRLRILAADFQAKLDQAACLTAEYSDLLAGVPPEIAEAEAAGAAGDYTDMRDAMLRAWGGLNAVVLELFTLDQ
jgi:hypothetical protein